MRAPRSRSDPSAGTPSSDKRNRVSDVRLSPDGPRYRRRQPPASRLGQLLARAGTAPRPPSAAARPSPNTVDRRTVSNGSGSAASVCRAQRVAADQLLAVRRGRRRPRRRRPSAACRPRVRGGQEPCPARLAERAPSGACESPAPRLRRRRAGRPRRCRAPRRAARSGADPAARATAAVARLGEVGGRGAALAARGRRRAPGASSDSVQRSSGCSTLISSGPAAACSQLSTPGSISSAISSDRLAVGEHGDHARRSCPRWSARDPAPRAASESSASCTSTTSRKSPGPSCACSSAGAVIAPAGRAGREAVGGSGGGRRRRVGPRGGLRPAAPRGVPTTTRAQPSRDGRSIMRVNRRRNAARVGGISSSRPDDVGEEARASAGTHRRR